ncbi:hypothetical protein [Candidatus Nitrosopumilus salaria]|nr:hypothetical protein [Candidatus Nitrosopumilus salaria]
MKIYYAHAMPIYGTKTEMREKEHIMRNLPEIEIVDPGSFQDNLEKQKEGMEYCFKLIEKCQGVIFTKFFNYITAGVGKEINYALSKSIPVHELERGKLYKITKPVKYLNRLDTIILYRKIRMVRKILKE